MIDDTQLYFVQVIYHLKYFLTFLPYDGIEQVKLLIQ